MNKYIRYDFLKTKNNKLAVLKFGFKLDNELYPLDALNEAVDYIEYLHIV
ncbi:hypothetical protein VQL36_11085 [Chengkuizengella sp. SCS-71B]